MQVVEVEIQCLLGHVSTDLETSYQTVIVLADTAAAGFNRVHAIQNLAKVSNPKVTIVKLNRRSGLDK